MNKTMAALVLGAVTTVALLAQAQFKVKEGPEACMNAHAVIVASKSGKHDYVWSEIARVVKRRPHQWQIVEDYEPGVSQRVSFRQYDLKYHEGGTAYVAHCGHGGTCNALVKAFFEEHQDWYSPEVFCGAVPEALVNPQRPSL